MYNYIFIKPRITSIKISNIPNYILSASILNGPDAHIMTQSRANPTLIKTQNLRQVMPGPPGLVLSLPSV